MATPEEVATFVAETIGEPPNKGELAECHRTLSRITQALVAKDPRKEHIQLLHDLSQQLHVLMRALNADDLYICRRTHTDCCIIQSLLESSMGMAVKAIATLDHALIISGAPGPGRFQLIQDLIEKFQADVIVPASQNKPWLSLKTSHFTSILPSAGQPIPSIAAPSLMAFQSRLFRQPFIVHGYAKDWPALQEHPWNRASYLQSIAGPGRVVPVEVGGHYLLDNWSQQIMSWDELLSMLDFEDQPARQQAPEKHYLAQHNLFTQFPELRNDILVPDYAYAIGLFDDLPDYKPPGNEEGLIYNTWLGPKGTVSPAHIDPFNNLYVQIVGRKTVWLAPPTVSEYMISSSPEARLKNTSCHDVFASPDPEIRKHVVPHAISAILESGDLLYFPAGWWHAMRSENTSMSLSLWF